MGRRVWVGAALLCAVVPMCASRVAADEPYQWVSARELRVEGQGWSDTAAPFDRLPARAEKLVRPAVWSLSRHSAGISIRFRTNSPQLRVRWTVTSSRLAMPHMPATGVSGLDLYVRQPDKRWRWLAVARPVNSPTNETDLFTGLEPAWREYRLYLPLYNGVSSVELAAAKGYTLQQPEAADAKPIVFYGTSITQGGCASRPGMVHTSILSRRLDVPVINLGFSGNGTMDPEMAELLAELDAAAYVIDCLPNMTADQVAARTEPLVDTLRAKHPKTPIVLVEDRTYADAFMVRAKAERNRTSREALRAAYERLRERKVPELYYLEGDGLLAADGEDTVDSSHPTDLGFVHMADAFERLLVSASIVRP